MTQTRTSSSTSLKVLDLPARRSFGETRRPGAWWLTPVLTFMGLGAFVVYATWAAFQGKHYHFGPYLSPFYSPLLFGPLGAGEPHALFGAKPGWYPGWLPWSRPARWASRANRIGASGRFR
jgi:hypothetical protein